MGQLGDTTQADSPTPVPVAGVTGAVSVAAGTDHSCAARGDGSLSCWGDNAHGQLGDGTQVTSLTPVDPVGW